MKYEELVQLEMEVMEKLVQQRKLGGYSAEATQILFLLEGFYKLVQFTRENAKNPRKLKYNDSRSRR